MTHWLGWLIGALGFGGLVIVILGLTIGWPILLAFMQTKVGRWLAIISAGIVAVVVALGKARDAGIEAEKAKQEAERLKAIKDRKESDAKIDAKSPDAVRTDLDKWMRD